MLNLDVDLLRAFVAVADTGGFTSASRQLHRTQSAVSMQVKRIEAIVGKQVFDRSGRSVRLTSDGEVLLSHARRMLKINEEAIADLVTPEIEGVVRLGIPDGYGTYYLPRVLSSFSRANPRVKLEVHSELTRQMFESLNEGALDLALLVRGPLNPGGEMLWAEPIVWVDSKETPIHEESPLPLALFAHGCALRANALDTLDNAGRRWRQVYCSPSLAAIQAAVLAGLGVAILGSSTVLPGMRTLGPAEGFPLLAPSVIELHRSPTQSTQAIERLAQHITDKLKHWGEAPSSHQTRPTSITAELSQVS